MATGWEQPTHAGRPARRLPQEDGVTGWPGNKWQPGELGNSSGMALAGGGRKQRFLGAASQCPPHSRYESSSSPACLIPKLSHKGTHGRKLATSGLADAGEHRHVFTHGPGPQQQKTHRAEARLPLGPFPAPSSWMGLRLKHRASGQPLAQGLARPETQGLWGHHFPCCGPRVPILLPALTG